MMEPSGDADMEVDSDLSPLDRGFISFLQEPLASIANAVIRKDENDVSDIANRITQFEIALKEHALRLVVDALKDHSKYDVLGFFWRKTLDVCQHFVHYSEQDPLEDQRYEGLEVRKIPILLLEDILDSLPVDLCQDLWKNFIVPAYDILFSTAMWDPSPKHRPCWLPFLRMSNRFMTRLPPEEAASIMITLSRVYPMSEKSALRPWGSYNADNVTELETEAEFQLQQTDSTGQDNSNIGRDEDGSIPDYSFYGAFWSIQKDFNHPTGISVADFLTRLSSVFNALESRSHLLAPNPLSTTKYLTSSRILHKQLADPDFRMHILIQFLIAAHHLSSQVPVMAQKLEDYQRRARLLLKAIENHGAKLLSILEYVLDGRETEWRKWKQNKCLPELDAPHSARKLPHTKKRARDLIERVRNSNQDTESTNTDDNLEGVARKMRKVVPSLESHLEEYVEALDPEAGIEAEYHPKNDSLFSWRAFRLLASDHLDKIPLVFPNGDFEGMVRHVYQEKGTAIPGDCPIPDDEIFEPDNDRDAGEIDENDQMIVEDDTSVEADGSNLSAKQGDLGEARNGSLPSHEEINEDSNLSPINEQLNTEATDLPSDEAPHDEEASENGVHRSEAIDETANVPQNVQNQVVSVAKENEDTDMKKGECAHEEKTSGAPDKENGGKSLDQPFHDPEPKSDLQDNVSITITQPKLDESKSKIERISADRDARGRPPTATTQDRPPRPYDGPSDNRRPRDDRQVRDWRESERRGDGGFRGHIHRGPRDDRRGDDRRGDDRRGDDRRGDDRRGDDRRGDDRRVGDRRVSTRDDRKYRR